MPPVAEGVLVVLEEQEVKADKYELSDAFMTSIHAYDLTAAKKLVERGALHACALVGLDALAKGVEHGFKEVVSLMIEQGLRPEAHHLCSACAAGGANGAALVEVMLLGGADANSMTALKPPFTALMHAASNGHAPIVKVLLDHKATPNVGFDEQATSAIELAEARGHEDVVALLEPYRLPTLASLLGSIEGGDNHTALRMWIQRGGSPCYRFVARTSDGRVRMPLLVYAAMYGSQPSVETLLEMGAFIDAAIVADRDDAPSDGMTALMYACREDHVSIVQLLLSRGADPALRSNDGLSVLSIAKPASAEAVRAHQAQSKQRSKLEQDVTITSYSLKRSMDAAQRACAGGSGSGQRAHALEELEAAISQCERQREVASSSLVAPLLADAKRLLEQPEGWQPGTLQTQTAGATQDPAAESGASDAQAPAAPPDAPAPPGVPAPPSVLLPDAQAAVDETQAAVTALLSEQAEMQTRLAAQVERHEKAQREIDAVVQAVKQQLELSRDAEGLAQGSPMYETAPETTSIAIFPHAPAYGLQQGGGMGMHPMPAFGAYGLQPPPSGYVQFDAAQFQQHQQAQQWRMEQWLHSIEARIAPLEAQGTQLMHTTQQQLRVIAMQVEQHKQLLDHVRSQQRHCLEVRLKAVEAQIIKGGGKAPPAAASSGGAAASPTKPSKPQPDDAQREADEA